MSRVLKLMKLKTGNLVGACLSWGRHWRRRLLVQRAARVLGITVPAGSSWCHFTDISVDALTPAYGRIAACCSAHLALVISDATSARGFMYTMRHFTLKRVSIAADSTIWSPRERWTRTGFTAPIEIFGTATRKARYRKRFELLWNNGWNVSCYSGYWDRGEILKGFIWSVGACQDKIRGA